MRTSVKIGDLNNFGVKIVGGPYLGKGRGSSTKWDFLCPYCQKTFKSPTTKFNKSKSCYDCRGVVLRSVKEDTTWDYLFHVVKGRKTSKEKGFGLTKKHFKKVSQMNCYYCGQEPTITSGYKEWHPKVFSNGLDRVDSSVGYFDDNIVACCKYCNVAKLDRTKEEFLEWIIKVMQGQTMSHYMSTHISASWMELPDQTNMQNVQQN
jgi:hypothetical protein